MNSLYLLCRAYGLDIDYDEISEATPVGPAGSSLEELVVALDQLGVSARVGRGSPADLKSADLPLVAHLDTPTGAAVEAGHYVLVTGVDSDLDIVSVFDGATALATDVPMDAFRRQWSGYVIEIQSDRMSKVLISILAILAAVGAFVVARSRAAKVQVS